MDRRCGEHQPEPQQSEPESESGTSSSEPELEPELEPARQVPDDHGRTVSAQIRLDGSLVSQVASDSQLESMLRDQIETLADTRTNFEMHRWWNWDPEGRKLNQDHQPPTGDSMQVAPELVIEVVVADLHDRVIDSCHEWFAKLGLPRPCLMQAPMQEALLQSLHSEEDVRTFVIYGAYGNGQVESALQKQLMEAFPEQLHSIQAQALRTSGGASLAPHSACRQASKRSYEELMQLNMANQGRVWVAEPTPTHPIQLVACAAYPRCQSPSEAAHIGHMFQAALKAVVDEAIMGSAACPFVQSMSGSTGQRAAGGGRPNSSTNTSSKVGQQHHVRVVTHALGSFVGHNEPELFGYGLATGLADFLKACS